MQKTEGGMNVISHSKNQDQIQRAILKETKHEYVSFLSVFIFKFLSLCCLEKSTELEGIKYNKKMKRDQTRIKITLKKKLKEKKQVEIDGLLIT